MFILHVDHYGSFLLLVTLGCQQIMSCADVVLILISTVCQFVYSVYRLNKI